MKKRKQTRKPNNQLQIVDRKNDIDSFRQLKIDFNKKGP